MSEQKPEPAWWSWQQVLKAIPSLGIPHFQRGQVWAQGNRTALLESMFEASPCGSFVFWKPSDEHAKENTGVPLCSGCSVDSNTTWLVDGQQRTRTLLSVYQQCLAAGELLGEDVLGEIKCWMNQIQSNEEDNETTATDEEDENALGQPTWYAVLPALSSLKDVFGDWSNSAPVLRGSLFRSFSPRLKKTNRVPSPFGMVPLGVLLAQKSGPFADEQTRQNILEALHQNERDNETLDRLIPWGPQFIIGFTNEDLGDDSSPPLIGWEKIGDSDKEQEGLKKLEAILRSDFNELTNFHRMLTGPRFAVGHLPPDNLATAINAYVRINRAGVRVRKEEQALALLTRWDEDILNRLGEFSRARDEENTDISDDRSFLVHESDKQMGFSIWMSTVTRYTALFLLAKSARHWFGVSALDRMSFADQLERNQATAKTLIQRATKHATEALLLVDQILSNELMLDHRMARRDTHCLIPILELLSRLSSNELNKIKGCAEVMTALSRLLHLTMLHSYLDGGEMQGLCDAIHGPVENETNGKWETWDLFESGVPSPSSAFGDAMRRYIKELYLLWMRERRKRADAEKTPWLEPQAGRDLEYLNEWALEQFQKELVNADNLQKTAVGWLYAIERRGKAKEFDWGVQVQGYKNDEKDGIVPDPSGRVNEAQPLAAYRNNPELHPEKQHIVPFSYATKIVGKGGSRSIPSEANSIGNLTWLSCRQNSYDKGFSNRWTVFNDSIEPDNLKARGMLAKSESGKQALDFYRKIQELAKDLEVRKIDLKEWPDRFATLFDEFRRARTDWMQEQMRMWLDEDLGSAKAWLVND